MIVVCRNQFVTSCSLVLDFLEKSLHENVVNHGKRVCLIAMQMAELMGIKTDDLFDLYAYTMLHDNGITHKLYCTMLKNGLPSLEGERSHCVAGERNLESFPFLKKRENILLYHHECYDGSGFFGLKGIDIPLFSQIIHLADMAEVYYRSMPDFDAVKKELENDRGVKFSPELCDVFDEVSGNDAFWLGLDDMFIADELSAHTPQADMSLDFNRVKDVSKMMRRITDEKSPFTARHSEGLSEKAADMADFYGFHAERKIKFEIAANLHDIGKLVVPNEILDKPGSLDRKEFNVVRQHTFYTRKALEQLPGFDDITEWASNHHERLDGKGYPYGLDADRLDFESRLMACLDIYQALTEQRPYRDGMTHNGAMGIIRKMVNEGALSAEISNDIDERYK